ncbi:MAG: 1-acyl-sn-glycerol-3-phosphate acyltransferase [Anaerolineae bacterium]|nr:1-acyl-sn-glycerol-3-phosphate acyltransferase [Anaerolineae bacterium]
MKNIAPRFPYPRRRLIRGLLQRLAHVAFAVLTDLQITGQENLPKGGPLLVVANHFSFIDPVAMVRAAPWPLEFVGGFQMPNAPASVTWIPKVWGYYPVFRGTGSRYALRAAEAVLAQGGVLGIFPEAGSWATVLRPPRPGAAFLAVRTGAPILPMGFDGLPDVFPRLRKGRRARVTVRIGKPLSPFHATGRGRARRQQLEAIGHEIMRRIAELIPPERRGHYSDDQAIRAAAQGSEIYPWADAPEG